MFLLIKDFLEVPLVAMMTIVVLGYLLGRITIKEVSLGTSGVLLVGLLFGHYGWLVDATLKNFGLICFVTAVGLSAGPVFFRIFQKKAFAYILLSVLVVLTGLLLTFFMIQITSVPPDLALGLFTGALTSTPGLAAAIEAMGEAALVGYGIAYPFGVICVVLFIQLIPRFLQVDLPEQARNKKQSFSTIEKHIVVRFWHRANHHCLAELALPTNANLQVIHAGQAVNKKEEWPLTPGDQIILRGHEDKLKEQLAIIQGPLWKLEQLGLFTFFLVAIFGVILAQIKIPLPGGSSFSLGNSGGPLILGLIAGHFGYCGRLSLSVPETTLKVLQEVGILFFLAGAGTEAGQSVVAVLQQYGILLFVIGAIITILPMLLGYILARYLFHFDLLDTLGAICGSMTSTPSLGALIQSSNSDVAAAIYAVTYPIALIMMVFSAQLTVIIFG